MRNNTSGHIVARRPAPATRTDRLKVNVIFTNIKGTKVALKRALELITDLEGETRIIVPYVVPYPLPIDKPDVPIEFTSNAINILARSVGADPCIDIYLCRDRIHLLHSLLLPQSIVVIGSRKRWFYTKADRLARFLRNVGCNVLLAYE